MAHMPASPFVGSWMQTPSARHQSWLQGLPVAHPAATPQATGTVFCPAALGLGDTPVLAAFLSRRTLPVFQWLVPLLRWGARVVLLPAPPVLALRAHRGAPSRRHEQGERGAERPSQEAST